MDIFNEFCIEIIKKANKNQAHYYSDITGDFFFKVIFFVENMMVIVGS